MTRAQAAIIRAAYGDGDTIEDIAGRAGVTIPEAETYLAAWLAEGAPEGGLP